MQLEAPGGEAVPRGQSVQAEALVLEKVPALHDSHELLPTASLYLPASQPSHASAWALDEVPAGQAEQFTDRAAAYVPASHDSHEVAPVFASVEKPAPQSRQASSCAVGAYVPVGQISHADALNTYCPASHVSHWVRSTEEKRPVLHAAQLRASRRSLEHPR